MPKQPVTTGRPPKTSEKSATKMFRVKTGHKIMGFNGVYLSAGDPIELTQAQAKFFQARGCIEVDMSEVFDDEPANTAKDTASTQLGDVANKKPA